VIDAFRCEQRLDMKGLRPGCPCCRPGGSKRQHRRAARKRLKRALLREVGDA
jgi:hypothetical protein